ncbi:MAG TPA: hypothetical protein VFD67_12780 [Gemmatimonadaceae bacterium]|nr:hypothetical protein [Gemmatimonadaceae bacterium]
MKKLVTLGLGVATLGVALSSRASAQAANNNTTIPFVVVTLFTPGTVAVPMDLAVATAVESEMVRLLRERQIISPITGVAIPPEITTVAISMMTTATPEVRAQMEKALSTAGTSSSVQGQLISNLPSLLSRPTAGQLQNALSAFNGFVNNANAAFLVNPPAEFLALHAILLQVSVSANRIPH